MIHVEPFVAKHIQDAATLFIGKYKRYREHMGCLPLKYEKTETITHLLQDILKTQDGVVAISNGRLVGYLACYSPLPNFKGISSGVYIPEWAHSVQEGEGTDKERIFQSMYSTIAQNWIGKGCFTHAITFLASDTSLRNLLYWNGFGLLVVDAIRAIDRDDRLRPGEIDAQIVIRDANNDDLEGLARLDNDLYAYLAQSPTFLHREGNDEQETAGHFLGEKVISVVAEKDHRILACIRGTDQRQDSCTIVQDERVMGINFAYTDPDIRGTGVGKKSLARILEWGKARGKTGCAVDFESANVLGRSFWLKHFTAVCFSAIRFVDPRLAHSDRNP